MTRHSEGCDSRTGSGTKASSWWWEHWKWSTRQRWEQKCQRLCLFKQELQGSKPCACGLSPYEKCHHWGFCKGSVTCLERQKEPEDSINFGDFKGRLEKPYILNYRAGVWYFQVDPQIKFTNHQTKKKKTLISLEVKKIFTPKTKEKNVVLIPNAVVHPKFSLKELGLL